MKLSPCLAAALIACLAPQPSLFADTNPATPEMAATGRQLLKARVDAIIGIELVVTAKVTTRNQSPVSRETKREVNGTVISPEGLTVISLSSIDPRGLLPSTITGMRVEDPEYKEVKLRLTDGSEIPSRIVLQDSDLDLAFIAPNKDALMGRTFVYVNLAEASDAMILDNGFEILRAGKTQQRTPLIRVSAVQGIIRKPRHYYLMTDNAPGCPTFDPTGRIIGLSVRHMTNGSPGNLILLPATDIAEMAKQAAAKALEEPPAPPPAPTPAAEPAPTPAPAAAPAGESAPATPAAPNTPAAAPATETASPSPAEPVPSGK